MQIVDIDIYARNSIHLLYDDYWCWKVDPVLVLGAYTKNCTVMRSGNVTFHAPDGTVHRMRPL